MDAYQLKFKDAIKGRPVVFIDVANLERSVQDMYVVPKDIPDDYKNYTADNLKWSVDYKKFRDFFNEEINVEEIRFYTPNFESDSHINFLYFLKKALKFKIISKALKEYKDHMPDTPHRKANFDVEIAVDATFLMDTFDTFILFSGDCDFEYLLKFLRGKNKNTIIFSRTGHIAKELPPASNYYFDIIDFRDKLLKVDLKSKESRSKAGPCS